MKVNFGLAKIWLALVLTSLSTGALSVDGDKVQHRMIMVKIKDQINDMSTIKSILDRQKKIKTQFSKPFEKVLLNFGPGKTATQVQLRDRLTRYFLIQVENEVDIKTAQDFLTELKNSPEIENAYFEPLAEDAVIKSKAQTQPMTSNPSDLQDYEPMQFYLNQAPNGVDARYGWNYEGGRGEGVRILDLETGWVEEHPEFGPRWFASATDGDSDHGTAVWGEIAAKDDGVGITGIAPNVEFGTAGVVWPGNWADYTNSVTESLALAVSQMFQGDILVVEQQARSVQDEFNYRPIEYFDAIFDLLKAATDQGIHCVAAGTNGSENLDDPKWGGKFNLEVRDSGCILVGAAGSPQGGAHLLPLYFTDYGSRIDAYAFGENVVTTGYGDLFQDGLITYTQNFGGTSSATPIVAGVVAQLVAISNHRGVALNPLEVREALRSTGVPQAGGYEKPIGKLPNLPQLLAYFDIY